MFSTIHDNKEAAQQMHISPYFILPDKLTSSRASSRDHLGQRLEQCDGPRLRGSPPGEWGCPADQREKDLGRIAWMLADPPDKGENLVVIECSPPITDSEEKNRYLIMDAVGEKVLEGILADTLNLLGTSAAVYEKDGGCSLRVFSSGWCRFMESSYKGPGNGNGLEEGELLCHHCCRSRSTQLRPGGDRSGGQALSRGPSHIRCPDIGPGGDNRFHQHRLRGSARTCLS